MLWEAAYQLVNIGCTWNWCPRLSVISDIWVREDIYKLRDFMALNWWFGIQP
ncbi:hypothetical protein PHMEG_0002424 [Phytophthora megakarya]|uniref:Uncharacterized protein n=1 Tax=Phytophthora megakarya TaxID=4795 RepID=A0A225WYD0_9STRA|nr:hypothetical protein PHMEG_0002424 [Phytophthora megakarya]